MCECVGRHHCWVAGPLGLGPIRVRLSLYIVPILYAIQSTIHSPIWYQTRLGFLFPTAAGCSIPAAATHISRRRPREAHPSLPGAATSPAAASSPSSPTFGPGGVGPGAGARYPARGGHGAGWLDGERLPGTRPWPGAAVRAAPLRRDLPGGGAAPRRSDAAGPSHSTAARPRRRLASGGPRWCAGGPAAHNHTGARHCRPHPACTRVSRRPSARSPLSPWQRFSTGPPPALPARPPMVLRQLGSPACAPSGGVAAAAVAGLTCLWPSSALQRRSPPPSRQPELFPAPLPCVGVFARAAPCHRASHLLIARVDVPAAPPT